MKKDSDISELGLHHLWLCKDYIENAVSFQSHYFCHCQTYTQEVRLLQEEMRCTNKEVLIHFSGALVPAGSLILLSGFCELGGMWVY